MLITAKTCRQAVVKRSDGGRVPAARFAGRCAACGTGQTAEFVRLRVAGKTCPPWSVGSVDYLVNAVPSCA